MGSRMTHTLAAALAAVVLAAPARAAPAVHTVVIDGMRFIPQTLEVKTGDTVIWRNKDPFPHNVVAPGGVLASPDIAAGASWKFKAGKRGSFAYVCTLHRTMTGTLIVK